MSYSRKIARWTTLAALSLLPLHLPAVAEPSPQPAEEARVTVERAPETQRMTIRLASTAAEEAPPVTLTPRQELERDLAAAAPKLNRKVLARALDATACAIAAGEARNEEILTVIDYSLPSTAKRMWVFDMAERELLFHELVAHGKNTGGNMATAFSNTDGSLQTSLGLFRTADTYYGKNGYSLRLHGLEAGINDLALPRTIVIHGAWYVSDEMIKTQGRIGRSWGCPAVREQVARPLIDTIKEGSLVFAYYPDQDWIGGSKYLNSCPNLDTAVAAG